MALFKILKGDSSRISTDVTPFHDGYAYLTSDDGSFYIDSADQNGNKRILINPKDRLFRGMLTAGGWSSGVQHLSIPGLTADYDGMAGIDGSASEDLIAEASEANMYISNQTDGDLEITARGTVPKDDIPVFVVMFAQ